MSKLLFDVAPGDTIYMPLKVVSLTVNGCETSLKVAFTENGDTIEIPIDKIKKHGISEREYHYGQLVRCFNDNTTTIKELQEITKKWEEHTEEMLKWGYNHAKISQ